MSAPVTSTAPGGRSSDVLQSIPMLWRLVANLWALRRIEAGGRGISVSGRLWLHGAGVVTVGDETRFDGGGSGVELFATEGGRIQIGAYCFVSEGVSIEANHSIAVGNRVHLGPFVKIIDNDFHSLRGDRHQRPKPVPIVIEDGVEIGARAIVLPGVTIGKGARVHARAVVTRPIKPGAEVAGNPARPVRK